MLLEASGPTGRCSGCGRRPRRAQLRCLFCQAEDGIRDKLVTGVQTCALPILVLFIPWRVGAEESGAAKNGLRAQHLNNALTECLKWGREIGRASCRERV